MSSKTPILITGATGPVLAGLRNHPSKDTSKITALVRSPEKAKILSDKFGVKAVVG